MTVTNAWDHCLRVLYDGPASVTVVKGEWKTGKTDFTIHLTVEELKQRLKIVSEVAGNIRCFETSECEKPTNKDVRYIDNFKMLEAWLFSPTKKAFIYDEALKSTPSKRAMTALNAYWLKIVPELSKGRCHLFVLTQEESMTEKLFLHPTFRTAVWEKINLRKTHPQFRKMVKLRSKLLSKKFIFKDIPPTTICFNPYLSANWSMEPTAESLEELPLDMKVVIEYANGLSFSKIKERHPEFLHNTQVQRAIRSGLKSYIELLHVTRPMRREERSGEP